ncbi:MAG: hypothetical protein JO277_03445 [Candidatus Eremiobacteraeota bacterium]|nr:hypothetical protein [Candidatus Eremiobacteraeota bacterium]
MRFRVSQPILVIAAVCALAMLPWYAVQLTRTFHIDYVAFRCAGLAVLHGQDPYLDRSLHDCELARGLLPSLTVPAPHPPYAMALFAAAASLPESIAFAVWSALAIGAAALAARALSRLTSLETNLTASAIVALVLIPSLALGQLVPIAVGGATCALELVRERRWLFAAFGLCIAALLPNFALPAWIAAFVFVPRMRLPLTCCGLGLLALSVACVGTHATLQYFDAVLPAHGRSELGAFWQMGSATWLAGLGASTQTALALSAVLYAALAAAGIAVGIRLRARYGGDHWILASAMAFGVVGSPFVHSLDLGFALPLAFMLYAAAPERIAARFAAIAIVVPWQYLAHDAGISAAFTIPFLLVVVDAIGALPPIATAAIVAAIAAGSLEAYRAAHAAEVQLAAARAVPTNLPMPLDALAETRWGAFARAAGDRTTGWFSRVPTAIALLVLLGTAIAQSASYNRNPAARPSR